MSRPKTLLLSVCAVLVSAFVLGALLTQAPRASRGASAPGASPSLAASAITEPRTAPLVPGRGLASAPEEAVRRGFYGAPSGTHLRFAVDARQETELLTSDDGPDGARITLGVKGELLLQLLDRRADELLARVSVSVVELDLEANGQAGDAETCAAVARELAEPSGLRLRNDGTVMGWSFPPGMSPSARQVLGTLVALVRIVVPAGAGEAWSTKERDESLEYSVAYKREEADGGRSVVLRQRTESVLVDMPGARTSVDDDTWAEFDLALGWLVSAECTQVQVLDLSDAGLHVEARSRATWQLIEQSREVPDLRAVSWEASWSASYSSTAVESEQSDSLYSSEAIAHVSLEQAIYDLETVAAVQGLQSREMYEAREVLKALLRTRPEELERLLNYLSDGSLSEAALGVALSALGSVGTPEMQAFLGELLADGTRSEGARVLSLMALFQVPAPQAMTGQAVEQLWMDPTAAMALRSTALLLLGAQANGLEERCLALLAQEERAIAAGLVESYIAALGNARLFTDVERFLAHPDASVRELAERVLASR